MFPNIHSSLLCESRRCTVCGCHLNKYGIRIERLSRNCSRYTLLGIQPRVIILARRIRTSQKCRHRSLCWSCIKGCRRGSWGGSAPFRCFRCRGWGVYFLCSLFWWQCERCCVKLRLQSVCFKSVYEVFLSWTLVVTGVHFKRRLPPREGRLRSELPEENSKK
jgi:hypothetical protein